MAPPALATAGLAKTFPAPSWLQRRGGRPAGPVEALRGVDFEVRAGEIVGLLGPNGGGKTTLLDILATQLLPTSGSAAVDGFVVGTDDAAIRRRVGYCPSGGRGLYPQLTGRENLEFFARLAGLEGGAARERIERLWGLLGLEAYPDSRISRHSDGMRQRVALARALLPDPPILLLDEPTRSLDPPSARAWRDAVRRGLAGKTILVATHDLVEAEEFCDRLLVLSAGRLVGSGKAAEARSLAAWGAES